MATENDTNQLPQQYEPKTFERQVYQSWLDGGYFTADPTSTKPKYVIVLPPPNVTGVLHMGHALTGTLEDVLVRRKRMQGHNVLWLPGTDHAGIATQMVVERMIQKEEKISRHDLGREKFLERVWAWKEQSQGTIIHQLKQLGSSLDWTRLTFTLDPGVSHAVRVTFKTLFDDGLLKRDTAMIQWCPRCRTALSDLEVKAQERKGSLWHLRYEREDDPKQSLVVATTRPETLLGDTAVAVHPEDERFKGFIGKKVRIPLAGRSIPVIADEAVDRAFGSGALKITPAHDPADYAVGKKHGLPLVDIFDDSATLNANGGAYQGLSREKAREKIVADLTEKGLLVKEEPHNSAVGTCDRCGTIVEPKVSAQWFVDAAVLAKDAIAAVRDKRIRILPEEWEKTYFQWMENIRPWCVSRQLWWGHRIPAWHCGDCGYITVAVDDATACEKCKSKNVRQDDDVLDTWFSSGLWPFSTLGWPNKTADLKAFYPNDVMETGFDILFFWVARMIMLGMKLVGDIPFHTVYLHPMVRDESGQKMSKTKGNVKDPLEIIDRLGADPLRFTLCAMAVHGRDVLLSDSRIEGYRNFANKLWNASRFVLMHFGELKAAKPDREDPINGWLRHRFSEASKDVNEALDQYRFFDAANRLYQFVWNDYCDWYLELVKPTIDARKAKGDTTAVEVLEATLRLLHPIMPFVTETLWQKMPVREKASSICIASYPQAVSTDPLDVARAKPVGRLIALVDSVRAVRGEANLKPSERISLTIALEKRGELAGYEPTIDRLCNADVVFVDDPAMPFDPKDTVVKLFDGGKVGIPRDQLIDADQERQRVTKELESCVGELTRAGAKLKSEEFTSRAPEKVIAGVRARKEELEKKVAELEAYLKQLA